MATNFLKLFVRPQAIARMQTIRSLRHRPTHCIPFSTNSAQNQRNRRGGESCKFEARLQDHIIENDRRWTDFENKFNDREITMHQTIGNLSTLVDTGFARVDTGFARVDTGFAELKTLIASQHAKLEGSVTLIPWKIGILGAGLLFVLGFAGSQQTNFTE